MIMAAEKCVGVARVIPANNISKSVRTALRDDHLNSS